jgi:phosphohistidine phosphatase
MRLYLVRHGQALPKEVDPERGLTEAGSKGAEKVAALLERQAIEVEAVWESGKKRATQTAEIMAGALTSKAGVVRMPGLAPMDPVDPILEKLSSLEGDYMLVGHMPFLSILASRLVLGTEDPDVVLFREATVVCLEKRSNAHWAVGWMVTPGML